MFCIRVWVLHDAGGWDERFSVAVCEHARVYFIFLFMQVSEWDQGLKEDKTKRNEANNKTQIKASTYKIHHTFTIETNATLFMLPQYSVTFGGFENCKGIFITVFFFLS